MSGEGEGRLCKICSRSSCAAAPIKVRACGDTNNRPEISSVREIVILFGEYFIPTTNSRRTPAY
jgi:hypothetical protein